jgi:Zinc ribbon domain
MPLHEYECRQGHRFEKLFLTFKAADDAMSTIGCPTCGGPAKRVEFSVPYPAHFFGAPEGYHKPSPSKRHSYKIASAKHGNKLSTV